MLQFISGIFIGAIIGFAFCAIFSIAKEKEFLEKNQVKKDDEHK